MSSLLPWHRRFCWATAPLLLAGLLPLTHLSSGFAADAPPAPAQEGAPAQAPVVPPEADKALVVESVLPAPTEPLKDFEGRSRMVLDLPPAQSTTKLENGEPAQIPGIALWLDLRQAFVWPDRVLIERENQISLVQANTEIEYSPTVSYVVERSYKNLDRAAVNPMKAVQYSMATYARLVREMPGGKLLPDEDVEKLEEQYTTRIAELQKKREALKVTEEIPLYNSLSAEMVRLREGINLLPFRRKNPCDRVQFENRDVLDTLFSRGLLQNRTVDTLQKGSTTFWVTRTHGLPIKMEVTDNQGHVVIYFGFTNLKVNSGLRPGDLAVNAPPGTPRILVSADLSYRDWEDRMEKDLSKQVKLRDKEVRSRTGPKIRQR